MAKNIDILGGGKLPEYAEGVIVERRGLLGLAGVELDFGESADLAINVGDAAVNGQ